jgi:hypothetical protein
MHTSSARDVRIDVFRGLALLMIFTDHIDGSPILHLTYQIFGLSDAKDIFVFLSGISCCLLYGKLLREHGFPYAQRRALRRAAQIYGGYLLVGLGTTVVVLATQHLISAYYAGSGDFDLLFARPWTAMIAATCLYYMPGYLDILPLYIILVGAAPLLVLAVSTRPALTMALSALLWVAAGIWSVLALPNLAPEGVWGLNPFSWQFLFSIGLWVGSYYYWQGHRFESTRSIRVLCWMIVAANLAMSVLSHGAGHLTGATRELAEPFADLWRAVRSGHNEPVFKLVDFLAVAYLVASYVKRASPLLESGWCRPFVVCGRRSLQTFCVGAVLSMLCTAYVQAVHPGIPMQVLTGVLGWALMAGLAAVSLRIRSEKVTLQVPAQWERGASPG